MIAALAVALVLAVAIELQLIRALGVRRGSGIGAVLVLLLGGTWGVLEVNHRAEPPPPEDQTASAPMQSQACFKCHESHYESWQRTYHRTMTREATPENVKADFNNAELHYMGVTSRMYREGDRYFIDTVDPAWDDHITRQGITRDQAGPAPRRTLSVDRLVGSHWFQQLLHRDEKGRYLRLPVIYHIVEQRWVHINGAFLTPATSQFFSRSAVWNETCLYCHNTRVAKHPRPLAEQVSDGFPGYETSVGELGIACEACHGAAERHVRAHRNPARRLAQRHCGEADPTIINPAKLSVARADDICARCHGGTMPRHKEWDRLTFADPYLAGRDLKRFWHRPFSEAEQHLLQQNNEAVLSPPPPPEPLDGRFWGDGTPLTTALEYQGLALSACYQGGHGKLSCLSCHSMHHSDPNHQVKEGMRSNAACYSCHESYRERLVEHTHHPAGSPGSLCYNCHMPHQVFSLLDTHRSHRISIPRVKDSLGTGKPHACNLCHLDKSLGWTQEQLGKWYGSKPEPLPEEERRFASSVLLLARGDARTRAVVAGAFAWPSAHEASGRDWPVLLLTRVLEHERYEAVRYLAQRSLRALHGDVANRYNYQGTPAQRAVQLSALRAHLECRARPSRSRYPYLPLTEMGQFADAVFERLLRSRNDPDVTINE